MPQLLLYLQFYELSWFVSVISCVHMIAVAYSHVFFSFVSPFVVGSHPLSQSWLASPRFLSFANRQLYFFHCWGACSHDCSQPKTIIQVSLVVVSATYIHYTVHAYIIHAYITLYCHTSHYTTLQYSTSRYTKAYYGLLRCIEADYLTDPDSTLHGCMHANPHVNRHQSYAVLPVLALFFQSNLNPRMFLPVMSTKVNGRYLPFSY